MASGWHEEELGPCQSTERKAIREWARSLPLADAQDFLALEIDTDATAANNQSPITPLVRKMMASSKGRLHHGPRNAACERALPGSSDNCPSFTRNRLDAPDKLVHVRCRCPRSVARKSRGFRPGLKGLSEQRSRSVAARESGGGGGKAQGRRQITVTEVDDEKRCRSNRAGCSRFTCEKAVGQITKSPK